MTRTHSISPSRRSSRTAWCRAFALSWFFGAVFVFQSAPPLAAQQDVSPVLTIDQDRLFSETVLGAEARAEIERQAQDLATENARIESELIAEEGELTEQRATMDPVAFRQLADEFDQRVQTIRAEQDEKVRQLGRLRDEARAEFFNEIGTILSEIVREKGALVVLDRRQVILSADRIDITDEAILRVNQGR